MLMAMLYGAKDLRLERGDEPPVGDGQVKVRFGAGGICGSDLSYYGKGRVGDFAVMQPLCLGHEVSGEVVEVGAGVTRVKKGDRVAINPNQPCRICRTCVAGKGHLCLKMNFYGSAAVFPHIQGVFREVIVASEAQCFPVPQSCDFRTAAMAEPLAVALHAVRRAGLLVGKSVLVTGVGPIGSLCVLAARRAGAARIVVTDVADGALKRAEALGIDDAVNAVSAPERVEAWYANKGSFDVTFECSGNAAAMTTAASLRSADRVRDTNGAQTRGRPPLFNGLPRRVIGFICKMEFGRRSGGNTWRRRVRIKCAMNPAEFNRGGRWLPHIQGKNSSIGAAFQPKIARKPRQCWSLP